MSPVFGSLKIALNSGVVSATPLGFVEPSAKSNVGAVGASFSRAKLAVTVLAEVTLVSVLGLEVELSLQLTK